METTKNYLFAERSVEMPSDSSLKPGRSDVPHPTLGSEIAQGHIPGALPFALDGLAILGAGVTAFLVFPFIAVATIVAMPLLLASGFPQGDS